MAKKRRYVRGRPAKQGTSFGRIYPLYAFHDHDPVLDWIDWQVEKSGEKRSIIAARANISPSTFNNWYKRKTKRPQFASVAAVARACGATDIPITARGRKKV